MLKQNAKSKEVNNMEKNQPEMKFRAGAVTATVWQNKGVKDGTETSYSTVSLERSYKDKSDAWKSTSTLRIADLPKAALVLNKAYEYLVLNHQNN
jgi:hypothetical protein